MRLSALAQFFVELADVLGLVDLVVVGDWFVGKGWVTPEQLVALARRPVRGRRSERRGYACGATSTR